MADNKLEQMLEKLVNNDRAGADELFHEFVIEKSRGIYEKMLETDLEDLEVDEAKDEEVDEASNDEETNEASDEEVDESSDDEETNEATDEEVDEASDEEVDEASDEEVDENFGEITPEADPMGGDAADDMMGDIEADGEEGEDGDMGDEEEIEDRVVDLEDALDDLKAEFEKMMSGDSDDSEGDDDAADMDMDDEGDEDKEEAFDVAPELSVEDEAPAFEGTKTAGEQMREYVEKVTPKMGDTGTDGTKSPVAGKNDMGGDAGNIAQGGDEKGGKASAPKEDNAGNVNVPGAKASKSMSANAKGHGAEKKGAGETGTNSKSTIGS
ncbi:DNA polymerase V family protein [bacterium]|jgi:hypothetical protein|nr:DNA polymerase V family protein [bacterium]